jgi:pimeloyl-ACP methyl ester carboxylesterase
LNFLLRAGEKLNKIIGEGFHLLSFDPRGVNGSVPQASCYVTAEQRAVEIENIPWDLESQAGEMFTKAENKAKACEDTMGEYGAYVNTPQTAADMNSILDAIGQEKMYYWGFSCKFAVRLRWLPGKLTYKYRWHHTRPNLRSIVSRSGF